MVTEEKSNEITTVPKLLDIKGDAGGANAKSYQKEIVKNNREKDADYILAVKDNQKTLYRDIKDYFEGMESL